MSYPEIGPPPVNLPSLDQINTVYQLAKFDTDACLSQDRQKWIQRTRFLRHQDAAQGGHKHAFQTLRNKNYQPVHAIHKTIQKQAIMIPQHDQHLIYVDDPMSFQKTMPLIVEGHPCHILAQGNHSLTISPIGYPPSWPEEVQIEQQQVATAPEAIADHLNDFWQPYWNVPNPDQVSPEQMQTMLNRIPSNLLDTITLDDTNLWLEGIKRLKPNTVVPGVWTQSVPASSKCSPHLPLRTLKTS